jgi:hypothetical protein
MPRDKTIGSQGLEQGGPNLGNDYTRPAGHVEQNQTTNVGSKAKTKNKKKKGTIDNGKNEQDNIIQSGDE